MIDGLGLWFDSALLNWKQIINYEDSYQNWLSIKGTFNKSNRSHLNQIFILYKACSPRTHT